MLFKIKTKPNRLIGSLELEVNGKYILTSGFIKPKEYNPYDVVPWLIGNAHGYTCIVFASNEQDASDFAADNNMMDGYLVDTSEQWNENELEDFVSLGNDGKLFDLSDCYMCEVEIKKGQDDLLLACLLLAEEKQLDNLDFDLFNFKFD